ncbi:ATP/GTP-binding protein [Streptomyces sp. NPDC002073]
MMCPRRDGSIIVGGVRWSKTPPPGFGGGPDLEALAEEAVTTMRLLGADIGIAPKAGSLGTVGIPVWVWNQPSPRTTGPTSASATAMGVTVTATATVENVVWTFGDGTTVSCPFPGMPYQARFGLSAPSAASGQCGTAGYTRAGTYTVNATTTWAVHWVGGGQQGDLTTTRSSQAPVRIGELQVVGQ